MDRQIPRALLIALPLLLLGLLLLWLWSRQPTPAEPDPTSAVILDQRLLQVEQQLARNQRGLDRTEQRLADLEARGRVLRDEVLGLGQRAALFEESLQRMAGMPANEAGTALRLDEVELLLTYAEACLRIDGDLEGARRAFQLADGLLSALTAPQYVSLRQSLAQEQAALAAVPTDPRLTARVQLDALESALSALPLLPAGDPPATELGPLDRLLAALVDVRPRGSQDLLAPADQQRGRAALALELGLARLAIERRDSVALAAACARAEQWLRRTHAAGPALEAQAAALQALGSKALKPELPLLGVTLALLRAKRHAGAAP